MYKNIFFIILSIISFSVLGQSLKGNITDINKDVLSGANIIIKGENTGVSADKNGNYTLNLKANRSVVIKVSFIGYETKSIRIPMAKVGQKLYT